MLKCLLAPAALLYKAGVTFRHRLFDWGILKSEKFDIPVICIGNITVGGTGKTPMAEMVIAYMSQMHRVALLSRGPPYQGVSGSEGRLPLPGCGR